MRKLWQKVQLLKSTFSRHSYGKFIFHFVRSRTHTSRDRSCDQCDVHSNCACKLNWHNLQREYHTMCTCIHEGRSCMQREMCYAFIYTLVSSLVFISWSLGYEFAGNMQFILTTTTLRMIIPAHIHTVTTLTSPSHKLRILLPTTCRTVFAQVMIWRSLLFVFPGFSFASGHFAFDKRDTLIVVVRIHQNEFLYIHNLYTLLGQPTLRLSYWLITAWKCDIWYFRKKNVRDARK